MHIEEELDNISFYSYDNSEEEDIEINDIELNEELMDTDNMLMIDKKYYIGSYKYILNKNILLFDTKIHINTFMKYKSCDIISYLTLYSSIYSRTIDIPSIEIMQLQILPNQTYVVILKTFWIRIIQRAWKKRFNQKKLYILYRKRLDIIRNNEIGIRINNSYYGLYGLLLA